MMRLDVLEGEGHGDYSKESGINRRSALLRLQYLDLCSGMLIPDVMHDVLEGALQHELKLISCY